MILDNLDKDATCARAKKLLRSYHSLKRIAGRELTVLQSPTMNGMPRSQSVDNHNEQRIQERLIAAEEVPAILNAVALLDDDSRAIIDGQYIKDNLSSVAMATKLGMASTTFSKAKKKALICFAEAFDYEELLAFKRPFRVKTASESRP